MFSSLKLLSLNFIVSASVLTVVQREKSLLKSLFLTINSNIQPIKLKSWRPTEQKPAKWYHNTFHTWRTRASQSDTDLIGVGAPAAALWPRCDLEMAPSATLKSDGGCGVCVCVCGGGGYHNEAIRHMLLCYKLTHTHTFPHVHIDTHTHTHAPPRVVTFSVSIRIVGLILVGSSHQCLGCLCVMDPV